MARFASIFLLVLSLSSAVHAQSKDAAAPAPATAQSGDTSEDSSGRCKPSFGPDGKQRPKGSTLFAGVIYGPKCSPIEKARVILVGSGYIRIAECNAAGEFFFLDPGPQSFSLIVEKDGFKTTYIYGLEAALLKVTTVAFSLEVGSPNEGTAISALP